MKNHKDDWGSCDFSFVIETPEDNSLMWEERVEEAKNLASIITEGFQGLMFLAFIAQLTTYIVYFAKGALSFTMDNILKYLAILVAGIISYVLICSVAELICHLVVSTEMHYAEKHKKKKRK